MLIFELVRPFQCRPFGLLGRVVSLLIPDVVEGAAFEINFKFI